MNQRSLSLLIAVALGASSAALAAQDTTTRVIEDPPPAVESAQDAQAWPERDEAVDERDERYAYEEDDEDAPPLADADIEFDADPATRQARTQSPPSDPARSERIHSGFEDDQMVIDERRAVSESMVGVDSDRQQQDEVDYAEQPISGDTQVAGGGTGNSGTAGTGGDVTVQSVEGTPFAAAAGSEGFSEGASARLAAQRFERLDRDGDGQLSEQELAEDSALAERFVDYDINGDGMIARNEYQSWFAAQNWLEGDDARQQRVAGTELDEMDVDEAEPEPPRDDDGGD